MMLVLCLVHFNTSHVVIKPNGLKTLRNFIVNFNTSHVVIKHSWLWWWCNNYHISIHLMLLLNWSIPIILSQTNYFNTSHVVIKLLLRLRLIVYMGNFNTSHVVIKQNFLSIPKSTGHISIHLMLLLNVEGIRLHCTYLEFQYISCCY